MIYSKVKGDPYEVGSQLGKKLKKEGLFHRHILEMPEERLSYTRACIPLYETYYPQVLSEISGMAEALGVDDFLLKAFTLGMYAYSVDTHCSCIATVHEHHVFLGRNSDFLKQIKEVCMHCEYHMDDEYAFLGNTTSFVQMEDGMNEHGLAVGLTFVYPVVKKAGFNAGLLVRYLLAKCKSVEEAIVALKRLPIGSSQTLTMADASGSIAVVECNSEKLEIEQHKNHVMAVNSFHIEAMKTYNVPPSIDDLCCAQRYVTLQNAFQEHKNYDMTFVQNLLKGNYGFLCQYDPSWPADTIWSSIYDVKNKVAYLCDGNPSRNDFRAIDFEE